MNAMLKKDNFWKLFGLIFLLISVFMALVAVRTSKPLNCVQMTRYEDGSVTCEVKIIEGDDVF